MGRSSPEVGDDALGTSASAGLGMEWARNGHGQALRQHSDFDQRLIDGERQHRIACLQRGGQALEMVDAEGALGDVAGREEVASATQWSDRVRPVERVRWQPGLAEGTVEERNGLRQNWEKGTR